MDATLNVRSKQRADMLSLLLVVVSVLLGFLFFYPVVFSIASAFKTNGEILRNPLGLPSKLRMDNFIYLWNKTSIPQAAINSAFLTVTSVVCMILVIPMSCYAIDRRKGRMSNFLYRMFISGMMIPFQVYMIPLFRQMRHLGLFGTLYGPIFVYVSGACAFGTLLYCGFMKTVPHELEESAFLDGCNSFTTFWKIIFPQLKPCTASMIILQGVGIWNDFLMPLMVLPANRPKTINVEIYAFIGEFQVRWDILFTGTFISMVPVLVIFALLQKQFVSGIMTGAVKG
jgi:raffinose/stachyose/melibiose transport system permease protein